MFSQCVVELTSQQDVKQQHSSAGLFGAERWGVRVAGLQSLTMHNIYLSGPLTQPQCSWLFKACEQVMTMSGPDIGAAKVSQSVANVFNHWHVKMLVGDGLGFGGKIWTQTVDKFMKEMGRSVLKGTVESRLAARPAIPMQVPNIPPILTASQIDSAWVNRSVVTLIN